MMAGSSPPPSAANHLSTEQRDSLSSSHSEGVGCTRRQGKAGQAAAMIDAAMKMMAMHAMWPPVSGQSIRVGLSTESMEPTKALTYQITAD